MTRKAAAFPDLVTKRLKLRRVCPDDVDALHACFGNAEAMRYWGSPASRTREDTERIATWLAKTSSPYDHFSWGLADKKTGRCIGMVNYHHREARHRRTEIGYIVAPTHQRKGFATEAVAAMLYYCEKELKIHRFNALIAPENVASLRLVGRLGFTCEGGPLRDYWCVDGTFQSVMIYGRVGPAT